MYYWVEVPFFIILRYSERSLILDERSFAVAQDDKPKMIYPRCLLRRSTRPPASTISAASAIIPTNDRSPSPVRGNVDGLPPAAGAAVGATVGCAVGAPAEVGRAVAAGTAVG